MAHHRSAWPLLLLATSSAFAQYAGSTPPPAEWKAGFDSIKTSDGRTFLGYLAGPECMGRGTGQPGYQKAAEHQASYFKKWGLKPVGDNGTYFQNVPFWRSVFVEKGSEIKVLGSGLTLPGGEAFRLNGMTGSIDVTSTVVELTPNGDDPNMGTVNLAKRIVLLHGDRISFRLRNAITNAQPAAVFVIKPTSGLPEYTIRRSAPTGDAVARAPFGTISEKAANALLAGSSMTASGAAKVGTRLVRLVAKSEAGALNVPNVVGLLEGSDPTLKAEIVGVGAHLDHLGVSGGVVYPGADDDGSGSTALLQVIKAFATNPVKPRRSILFMNFCGEEMGLVGSGWYASHPIYSHDTMVAELQMDMVGRNSVGPQNGDRNRTDVESENLDTVRLVGSKRISTDLDKTIMEMNKHLNFRFKYDAEDVYTRSDHYNFAKNGIPIAFFFTGFHPEYHQPTDTIEKINFDKIANTAKLVYLTAATLATQDARPRKDVGK